MKARRRGPIGITEPIAFGTAELIPDPSRPGGRTLLIDGVPQSYVDLDDPTYLDFEYVRRLASVVDAVAAPAAPITALHLGGGALTVPRYVAATRPGSHQRVVEHDAVLIDLIRRALPLPRDADLRVRTGDARAVLEQLHDARFDLVISDVYRAAQMPRTITSVEFAGHAARVLRAGGLYAVNVADLPPLAFTRQHAATLREAFGEVCVIADPGMLRGRRYGNVVLAAAREPGVLPLTRLAASALRDPFPGRVLHGPDLDRFIGGARPVVDGMAKESPKPPPSLFA